MNSNMTRKQKEALAAIVISRAGDLVEFFAEIAKDNAALAGVSADQVSRQLSTWLNRLPGNAWDLRLQGYVNTPAVDEPMPESTVTVVDANQDITPTMATILRSAVPLNGMITVIPSDSAGAAELNELIDTGFLWEDSDGDVFIDTRGTEWLRENPARGEIDAQDLKPGDVIRFYSNGWTPESRNIAVVDTGAWGTDGLAVRQPDGSDPRRVLCGAYDSFWLIERPATPEPVKI